MKLIVKIFRVTTIRTSELVSGCGLDAEKPIDGSELLFAIKKKFSPLAPRFHIFAPSTTAISKTIVGMECACFDILEAQTPTAGLVSSDPMSQEDAARVDGAIESELNRMNCGTNFIGYEWRCSYQLHGN